MWVLLVLMLMAQMGMAKAQGIRAISAAEADRVCRTCHEKTYDSYQSTYMANASGLAKDRVVRGSFAHQQSRVDYAIEITQQQVALTYELKRPGAEQTKKTERLDYFLGSGHLGTTYLYSKNGYLFETPIAYYKSIQGYAMKPGYETSNHSPTGLILTDACLRCHMSAVQTPDAGTENHYSGLPFLHTGITCESCHGDTGRHVSSGGKASVVNPAKLTAARRDSVCIVCHLEGDTHVERAGRAVIDYKPGDDIREFMSYFVYAGAVNTHRAVSEIEQFSASRCKLTSGDGMSCMTCHDVHAAPAETERAAYYRGKCLGCHTGAKFAVQHHAENPDCTSCHMPKTGAMNVAHVAWTDHRIRRVPDAAGDLEPPYGQGAEVRSLLDQTSAPDRNSGPRELGLAYYDLVTKGDASEKAHAKALLEEAKKSGPGDIPVLRALGVLAEMDGRNTEAEQYNRALLLADPQNLTGITNLGTLLAMRGKLEEAESLWKPAFLRNEDRVELGRNLAIVECALGEGDAAKQTLERALVYHFDEPGLRELLGAIQSGQKQCR